MRLTQEGLPSIEVVHTRITSSLRSSRPTKIYEQSSSINFCSAVSIFPRFVPFVLIFTALLACNIICAFPSLLCFAHLCYSSDSFVSLFSGLLVPIYNIDFSY